LFVNSEMRVGRLQKQSSKTQTVIMFYRLASAISSERFEKVLHYIKMIVSKQYRKNHVC